MTIIKLQYAVFCALLCLISVCTAHAADNTRFTRRVVVEEGTGTWCRYCPRGIVGMKMMAEKYPDQFIGIAVHSGNDPMAIADYRPLQNSFATLPMCKADRHSMGDPYSDIERMLLAELEQECNIDYYLEVAPDGDAVIAYSSLTVNKPFAASDLNFAYVVIEDNVCVPGDKSYYQKNVFAGKDEEMGGWELLPEEVQDYAFMDVARGIGGGYDGKQLLENDLKAGETATVAYKFLLPENILDRGNVSVVGLVIDAPTGRILNAYKCPLLRPSTVNSTAITASEPVSTRYYSVDGRPAGSSAPCAGLYIRVSEYADGSRTVSKVRL